MCWVLRDYQRDRDGKANITVGAFVKACCSWGAMSALEWKEGGSGKEGRDHALPVLDSVNKADQLPVLLELTF